MIKIELIDSGVTMIKVVDDGIGMDYEDAHLAFLRHATSKLLSDDDLLLKWKYWETTSFGTRIPVTKSYYNKWVGGVVCGAYKDNKLVYVCTASNLSDELKAEIKEKGKDSYIGKVVEIQYQNSLISKDGRVVTLINPRFIRFREDKSAKECLQGDIT